MLRILLVIVLIGSIVYHQDEILRLQRHDIRNLLSSSSSLSTTATTRTSNSYELAYQESYGFFDDITDVQWNLMQQKARASSIFYNPNYPNDGITDLPLWMLNNVDPIFTCPHIRRVGGKGDGPKWTCDPHRLANLGAATGSCLIYSVGSSGDYRFEDGLVDIIKQTLNRTKNDVCEIHVFDPEPSYVRPNDIINNNIYYHPWGLVSSYRPSANYITGNYTFKSFQETQQVLGHNNRTINLFKIDCEGCEFNSYQDWITTGTIQQLLVEVHPHMVPMLNWNHITVGQFFHDVVNEHGYVPFSKEANTHPGALPHNTFFEFGFIKLQKSFLQPPPTSVSSSVQQ
jgi:hypothetical protein